MTENFGLQSAITYNVSQKETTNQRKWSDVGSEKRRYLEDNGLAHISSSLPGNIFQFDNNVKDAGRIMDFLCKKTPQVELKERTENVEIKRQSLLEESLDLYNEREEKIEKQMTEDQAISKLIFKTFPASEQEYTEVFQNYIADGVAVKDEIVTKIQCLQWVESVSLGFSTKQDGYWPVIRVSLNEKTCEVINSSKRKVILSEIAESLKISLEELYSQRCTWADEEIERLLEVTEDYSIQSVDLCSAGGDISSCSIGQVDAEGPNAGHHSATYTTQGTVTCNVQAQLKVGEEVYCAHYAITAFHVVVPFSNPKFRSLLGDAHLPLLSSEQVPAVKYEVIEGHISQITYVNGFLDDQPLSVPTLLKASFFPDNTANAFQQMKTKFGFSLSITSSSNVKKSKTEFVAGKMGLIKKKRECYEHVLLNYSKGSEILKHPCNVDIAVLKYKDNNFTCSIEESVRIEKAIGVDLPRNIQWRDPPTDGKLDEWKGIVVFIKAGVLHKLSDRLSQLTVSISGNRYPNCSWEVPRGVEVTRGDSGSPVFLLRDNALRLIGILITRQNASPIHFSIDLIKSELMIDHIEQKISQMEIENQYLVRAQMPEIDEVIANGEYSNKSQQGDSLIQLECLRMYHQKLEEKRNKQCHLPFQPYRFSQLMSVENILTDDKMIDSKIEICINKH